MSLEVVKHDDPGEARSGLVEVKERLWLTADGDKVVPEGHPDAATLFAIPGWSVPRGEAIRVGLIDGPKDEAGDEGGLDKLTVRELDELAAEHDVADYPAKGKKAEKVAFLEAALAAGAAPDSGSDPEDGDGKETGE